MDFMGILCDTPPIIFPVTFTVLLTLCVCWSIYFLSLCVFHLTVVIASSAPIGFTCSVSLFPHLLSMCLFHFPCVFPESLLIFPVMFLSVFPITSYLCAFHCSCLPTCSHCLSSLYVLLFVFCFIKLFH